MALTYLMKQLCNNLKNAESAKPEDSILCIGFTKQQLSGPGALALVMKGNPKYKPRAYWYDKETDCFYEQGDYSLFETGKYKKINGENFKKDAPATNLRFYVPASSDIMAEAKTQKEQLAKAAQ